MRISPQSQYKTYLALVETIIYIQRTLRLLVRAVWLIGSGFLLFWGMIFFTGWHLDWRIWLLFSLCWGIIPFARIFFPLRDRRMITWKLDRKFGFEEQVSTAWQIIRQPANREIDELLIRDAIPFLKKSLIRVLLKGWYLGKDLISLGIISILFLMVLQPDISRVSLPERSELPLPQVVREPVSSVNKNKEPQQTSQTNTNQLGGDLGSSSTGLKDAYLALGESLSKSPSTYELGQALLAADLSKASEELNNLAEQVPQFTPETRESLADAMKALSDAYSGLGMDDFSQDAKKVADALSMRSYGKTLEQHYADMKEGMNTVASDLQRVKENEASKQSELESDQGGGVGNAQARKSDQGSEFQRITGEGDPVNLNDLEEGQSKALRPGKVSENSTNENTGLVLPGNGSASSNEIVNSVIIPFRFSWKWQDVVTTYFSR